MLPKQLSAILPILVVAWGNSCTEAVAASNRRDRPPVRHAVQSVLSPQGGPHKGYVQRTIGYGRMLHPAVGWGAEAHGARGYVFAPGKGILDAPCNLPTSTCPNEMRDGQ
jgi:hypothetical protein